MTETSKDRTFMARFLMHFPGTRVIRVKPQAKEVIAMPVPQSYSVIWLLVAERNDTIISSLSESFVHAKSLLSYLFLFVLEN